MTRNIVESRENEWWKLLWYIIILNEKKKWKLTKMKEKKKKNIQCVNIGVISKYVSKQTKKKED